MQNHDKHWHAVIKKKTSDLDMKIVRNSGNYVVKLLFE